MKNRIFAGTLSALATFALSSLSACSHDSATGVADHNLALSPLPIKADAGDSHYLAARAPGPVAQVKAPVAEVAPAPVAPMPVALQNDRCTPVALSAGAVGKPCLTTSEFIQSLGLTPKELAKALAMVAKADQSLAH